MLILSGTNSLKELRMGKPVLTIQEKLNSIARGLIPAGHELSYFLIFFILLILSIFTIYIFLGIAGRRELHKWTRKKYHTLIREFDLTIREIDLLDQMAVFLINPLKKYLLLQNRGTFSNALRHLSMVREIPEGVGKSLEEKLGFPHVEYTNQMYSTSDIARGVPVAVWDRTGKITLCHSEGHATGRLSLKAVKGLVKLKQGAIVTLFAYTYRYLYSFETKVVSVDRDVFTVSEVDTATLNKDSQKKRIELPVYITLESLEDFELETEIVRVIKGGAIIRNPDKSIRKRDDIRITFHPVYAKNYHLNGEVWKISRIHIKAD
jgi:hypothetical protein